ncbi:MAG TPA: c-type cytochrome [Anaerolineales bacterium]|nr:c-type cytochrome [Anaerolineales bacterium]
MESPNQNNVQKYKIMIVVGAAALILGLLIAGCQPATEEPAQPEIALEDLSPEKQGYVQLGRIELIPDDLLPPPLPEDPSQVDLGEQDYYQICLACHGNWGQGLTEEWRVIGFGEDQNCWQSKCHAPNHPPQGFEIPREMPPLLGRGSLSGLSNAEDLYQVILTTMPWWDPGQLSEEQSLNLTAYILNARGELPEGIVLTSSNLTAFSLHAPAAEITNPNLGGILLIFGLAVSMAAYIWTKKSPDSKTDDDPTP